MSYKIAVLGQMRAGKDTVAEILKEKELFIELKFSDGISAIIRTYFPEAEQFGKPRQHYQHIGQSLRQLDEDVWINRLDKKLKALSTERSVIVTDVRQENEVKYLKEQGFTLIKVIADDSVRIQRIEAEGDVFNPSMFEHETEQGILQYDCDFLINNSGSFTELQEQVDSIWAAIIGGNEDVR